MNSFMRKFVLLCVDLVVINIAYYFAMLIRFEGFIPVWVNDLFVMSWWTFAVTIICIYYIFGLYHSLWRYASINELVKLVLATTIAFIVNLGLSHLMRWDIPRSITIISYILTVMGVAGSRLSYRYLRRVKSDLRPKDNLKRVLIVGAGDAGATIIKELRISSHAQSQPIAIVDDANWKQNTEYCINGK